MLTDLDYLLIGTDLDNKFAFRFLRLNQGSRESLFLKQIPPLLTSPYLEFLLGSILLGSRLDEQESTLYKLQLTSEKIWINCEVSPQGHFRSAIFPKENISAFRSEFAGLMQVSVLKQNDQVYTSSIPIVSADILKTFRSYLEKSVQTPSLFFVHPDKKNHLENYALWIEKLPGTSQAEWNELDSRMQSSEHFTRSFENTNDPDLILKALLPFGFQILAVTKPLLTCACSLESFERALASLSEKDLMELWIEKRGVESECDYCGKVWRVEDDFLMRLLKGNSLSQ